jgi:hypothetical protein
MDHINFFQINAFFELIKNTVGGSSPSFNSEIIPSYIKKPERIWFFIFVAHYVMQF